MILKRFRAENFRNIESCDIEFCEGVNLLSGKNAQGKTNAIEGIYLFSRGKSFRSAGEKELVKFGEEGFRLSIDYESIDGENNLLYASFGKERLKKKNGYKINKVSEMIGSFKSVLFYPDNLSLVKDGPEERRSFLNIAVSQCYPSYIVNYGRFKEALENRNAILKSASKHLYFDERELFSWSSVMAEYASFIYLGRFIYIEKLKKYANKIESELSSKKENLELFYKSDLEKDFSLSEKFEENTEMIKSIKEEYERILTSSLDREKAVGTSLFGPHRDDILINLNGVSARNFASQGQQRSIVLSLKLAEGEVIKEMFHEYPVFLFDDVLSELDSDRRKYVIEGMRERQIIITSCEKDELEKNAQNIIDVDKGIYIKN